MGLLWNVTKVLTEVFAGDISSNSTDYWFSLRPPVKPNMSQRFLEFRERGKIYSNQHYIFGLNVLMDEKRSEYIIRFSLWYIHVFTIS